MTNRTGILLSMLPKRAAAQIRKLDSPEKIQDYLDRVSYCGEDDAYHCPLELITSGRGCCFAGALFGAFALSQAGHPPLVIELKSEFDDDHMLAVYKKKGLWGAVAKSHHRGLRAREPIYRTLRELALTYFEHYYNHRRQRTLRSYSLPLDLRRFPPERWMTDDSKMNDIADAIDRLRHVPLYPRRLARGFSKADRTLCRVGTMDD